MTGEYEIGGGWGNAINWFPDNQFNEPFGPDKTFRVIGWKPRIPRVGDTIKGEFEKSWIWFEFVEVERCGDPRDMFFGTVQATQQERK